MVRDNGMNVVAAITCGHFIGTPCLAHTLQLVIKDGLLHTLNVTISCYCLLEDCGPLHAFLKSHKNIKDSTEEIWNSLEVLLLLKFKNNNNGFVGLHGNWVFIVFVLLLQPLRSKCLFPFLKSLIFPSGPTQERRNKPGGELICLYTLMY